MSNSKKHTPGPWRLAKNDPNWIETKNGLIAMISDVRGDRNITSRTQANAALIAAAPEMLEALNESYEYIQACFYSGCPDHQDRQPSDDELELLNMIKTTLNKAKGDQ